MGKDIYQTGSADFLRGMGLNGGKGQTMNFFVYMLLHWLNYFI